MIKAMLVVALIIGQGFDSVQVLDPYLQSRVDYLSKVSPTFLSGLDSVRARHYPVRIMTLDKAREVYGRRFPQLRESDSRMVSLTAFSHDDEVSTFAVVIVPLARIRERVARENHGMSAAVLNRVVDTILIHEIYGHVTPVGSTGLWANRCPDPMPGQRDFASCVLHRENVVREELGWPLRSQYEVDYTPYVTHN